MTKGEIRQKYLALRSKISEADNLTASHNATRFVLGTDKYANSDCILLYSAVRGELSCREIANQALKNGKKIYYPKVISDTEMIFLHINSFDELFVGAFGIPEPSLENERYEGQNALCIVPGICFDKQGYRLGYGKGYYDRFLSGFFGSAIGLVYENFLLEKLPVYGTDIKVNYIVTDKKIHNVCEGRRSQ